MFIRLGSSWLGLVGLNFVAVSFICHLGSTLAILFTILLHAWVVGRYLLDMALLC